MENILWEDRFTGEEREPPAAALADPDGIIWAGVDSWLEEWEGAAR